MNKKHPDDRQVLRQTQPMGEREMIGPIEWMRKFRDPALWAFLTDRKLIRAANRAWEKIDITGDVSLCGRPPYDHEDLMMVRLDGFCYVVYEDEFELLSCLFLHDHRQEPFILDMDGEWMHYPNITPHHEAMDYYRSRGKKHPWDEVINEERFGW